MIFYPKVVKNQGKKERMKDEGQSSKADKNQQKSIATFKTPLVYTTQNQSEVER